MRWNHCSINMYHLPKTEVLTAYNILKYRYYMKKRLCIFITIFSLISNCIFAQITIWHDTAFVILEAEDYYDYINKPQLTWNDTYHAVGVEGNVISDEMLRTYLFSYLRMPGYKMDQSEISDIYETIQDFANGYMDEETLYCYFHDSHFFYIVFFRIILKKGQKIVVKQDATYIPVKQDY